jgi:hypothetical protein
MVMSLILTISRSYSNYQFAKFCWKSIVQPQLHAYNNGEGISENTITCWLLDNDPQGSANAGVFDRLLRHVDRISKNTKEARQKGNKQLDTRYDIRLAVDVNSVILCFGSAQTFQKPLFKAAFSQVSIVASGLISSKTGWVVPEKVNEDIVLYQHLDDGQAESNIVNGIHFRTTFSVYYLNTRLDQMESLVESYPCFGRLEFKTFVRQNSGGDSESKWLCELPGGVQI